MNGSNPRIPTVLGGLLAISVLFSVSADKCASQEKETICPTADGYRGIWYSNQPSEDQYRYKYSGGLGTYCAKHIPHCFYAPEVDKTFFVYGGTKGVGVEKPLLEMISYYDHKTGMVPQPRIVREKGTADAHHNPTISIDKDGFIWIFMSAHGGKDGFIYRSSKPYDIEAFVLIDQQEFTYPQPWYIEDFGFLFLFTKYTAGRELYSRTSRDGVHWGEVRKHAGFAGHYQISRTHENKCGTAFNYHPPKPKLGLNSRTNLYYMETGDFGDTWKNAQGEILKTPLSEPQNKALVHDYDSEGLLVYMKDINFDENGYPVILYLVSKGYESGPENDPRTWTTARWTGENWEIRPVTTSDHNYDMGSLYIEPDGRWRVIGPTEPGPQAYCTGGEVAMWVSKDKGNTWEKTRQLTANSERNHTYVRRPVNAHPDFYAFWADGDALKPSESYLYFTNKEGDAVWRLPHKMTNKFEKPEVIQ